MTSVSRLAVAVFGAAVILLVFVSGLLIGHLGIGRGLGRETRGPWAADDQVMKMIFDGIDADRIRENLREFTSEPRLAGTPGDRALARRVRQMWENQGLDRTAVTTYNVLLSYPTPETGQPSDGPNRVLLKASDGSVIFETAAYEKILSADQDHPDVVPPFNAYSHSGTPEGQIVYVNYARVEDFEWLKEQHVNISGKICISRYGKIFRGNKASLAEANRCSGLIMYTDPADYAVDGQSRVYPDSVFLPGTGVQRGTIQLGLIDTPGQPAIDSAYRLPEDEAGLPNIPVHPIGYDDAYMLLKEIRGQEAPEKWRGKLNITYRIGDVPSSKSVQMLVYNRRVVKPVDNVFGLIRGWDETDRYVLVGNHRDAWVFGAVDPLSGTAVMMELSRSLGLLLRKGWRPRRTIMFCSWAAEEYGLIGSQEWVENYDTIIGARAVAYINMDIAVQGTYTLRGRGLPMIKSLILESAKKVPNPNETEIAAGRRTVYDTMLMAMPDKHPTGEPTGEPYIALVGAGSDFAPFISRVGVSCADIRYHYNPNIGLSSYPLYHTVYETFHLVNDILDPTFAYHKATGEVIAEMTRSLAESEVLPLDAKHFGISVKNYVDTTKKYYKKIFDQIPDRIRYLETAATKFSNVSRTFQESVEAAKTDRSLSKLQLRGINDKLMDLERAFINPQGLPGQPFVRNVIFAPSAFDEYKGSSFPAITDILYGVDHEEPLTEVKLREIEQHLSLLSYIMERAAASLREDVDFMTR